MCYLAVKVITKKATAKYIKSVIVDILKVYVLHIQNVYSITTDSAANVLKTSRELIEDIQLLVDKEVTQFIEKELDLIRSQSDKYDFQESQILMICAPTHNPHLHDVIPCGMTSQ